MLIIACVALTLVWRDLAARHEYRRLLYDSDTTTRRAGAPGFTATSAVDVEGRPWTLRYSALPGFVGATKFQPPWVEFAGILTVCLLLFAMT